MILDTKSSLPNETFILSRNWDRFGGRLSEILNGYYLAKRFNLSFKFIWPEEDRFPEMKEMLSVFSQTFLYEHLISEGELQKAQIVQVRINSDVTTKEFLNIFESDSIVKAVTLPEFLKVPIFKGEEQINVLNQFKECSAEIWSEDVNRLINEVSTQFPQTHVLHVRYGDLVTGAWSNFVDPTKYLTWNQVRDFLEESEANDTKVILISDTKEISLAFSKWIEPVSTINSSNYKFAQENLETLVDLFKMQCSAGVYSPTASAYSTLGAHLSGRPICPLSVNRHSNKKSLEQVLNRGKTWEFIPDKLRDKLISRDLDQEINRLDGIFDKGLFLKLTRSAYVSDPKNVSSINHYAVAQALNGRMKLCKSLLQQSRTISLASAHVHQDPLYMSLVAEFLCTLIDIAKCEKFLARRFRILDKLAALKELKQTLMATLPYQVDKGLIEDNIAEIIRLVVRPDNFGNLISRALSSNKLLKSLVEDELPFFNNSIFLANLLVSLRIKLEGH